MDRSEIESRVTALVADVLGVEPSDIRLDSLLMADLGAESLDFLDILFQLEEQFRIQLPRGEIEGAARGTMTEDEFAPGGVISDGGLARLRDLIPESRDLIRPGLRANKVLSLFRVETFVKVVARKMDV